MITALDRPAGWIGTGEASALVAAQVLGGALGAVVANLMFDLDAVTMSAHRRDGPGLWLGEAVATSGLVLVVFGTLRSGRAHRAASAVAGYIMAAYWFTSSTSFTNPAVTVARRFSDTFAGIAPVSVAPFVLAQLVGGLAGYAVHRAVHAVHTQQEEAPA